MVALTGRPGVSRLPVRSFCPTVEISRHRRSDSDLHRRTRSVAFFVFRLLFRAVNVIFQFGCLVIVALGVLYLLWTMIR